MTPEINFKLTEIESVLINHEDPGYLEVSAQQNFIYILISKQEYKYYNLSERILAVFEILKWQVPHILEEIPVIIETFTEPELTDLFRMHLK